MTQPPARASPWRPDGKRRRAHERAAAAAGRGVAGRGVAVDADAQRDGRDLRARGVRVRLRQARAPGPGPDLVRAALPAARPDGAGTARQPGLGGRRRASTSATTYAGRRCPVPAAWTSCASWSRASCRGRSTAAARCGRSTSSRASPTAGSRSCRSRTRCWSTASTPSTSARCCSTPRPSPSCSAATSGARTARPSPFSLMAGAVKDSVTSRATVADTARSASGAALRSAAGARPVRRPGRRRPHEPDAVPDSPIIGPLSQQRRVVAISTPLAELPHDPRGARRHRQRRHPRDRHRRPARVADDPRRVDARHPPAPRRRARSR